MLERLQIDMALEFADETAAMADRCLEITESVLDRPASEAVLRFLRRVTRCYIAGFVPEAITLCRAVLENAITERYDREGVLPPKAPLGKSQMRANLDYATSLGWLSAKALKHSWTIWTRGNKAVHSDPTVSTTSRATVQMTVAVLRELYPIDAGAA